MLLVQEESWHLFKEGIIECGGKKKTTPKQFKSVDPFRTLSVNLPGSQGVNSLLDLSVIGKIVSRKFLV